MTLADSSPVWFTLIQSIGITASLIFAAFQLRHQAKRDNVATSLILNEHHRQLWSLFITDSRLTRVLARSPGIEAEPITDYERMFVNMLFLHISVVLRALEAKAIQPIEGLSSDVSELMSYPIPRAVWREIARFQDKRLKDFVARNLQASSQEA
jgi:uncharacterized membrane protein